MIAPGTAPRAWPRGRLGGVEILHISRHEDGHRRLSSHVDHRANIAALRDLGADAILAVTVCGAVDPSLALGELVVFDDLWFLGNRLRRRLALHAAHRARALRAAGTGSSSARSTSTCAPPCSELGATPGSRSATAGATGTSTARASTRAPRSRCSPARGVSAVSQTAGPETVLAGEARIPYALLGFVTDYANGVGSEPTPVGGARSA